MRRNMNIFILDTNQQKSAQYHVDKHIVKMPLETALLLCSAHHLSGTNQETVPYGLTHKNHPITTWVKSSISNYNWLVDFGLELCKEYTYRYNKIHKCEGIISWCGDRKPNIPVIDITPFVLAMPDKYKCNSPVESYREYYKKEKSHLFSWKNREKPCWLEE